MQVLSVQPLLPLRRLGHGSRSRRRSLLGTLVSALLLQKLLNLVHVLPVTRSPGWRCHAHDISPSLLILPSGQAGWECPARPSWEGSPPGGHWASFLEMTFYTPYNLFFRKHGSCGFVFARVHRVAGDAVLSLQRSDPRLSISPAMEMVREQALLFSCRLPSRCVREGLQRGAQGGGVTVSPADAGVTVIPRSFRPGREFCEAAVNCKRASPGSFPFSPSTLGIYIKGM